MFSERGHPPTREQLQQVRDEIFTSLTFTGEREDGARLKCLIRPWEEYSEAERAVAFRAIREALLWGLREYPDAALLFEVNEIPRDLDRQLHEIRAKLPRFRYRRIPEDESIWLD
jgi:hypothetical protein